MQQDIHVYMYCGCLLNVTKRLILRVAIFIVYIFFCIIFSWAFFSLRFFLQHFFYNSFSLLLTIKLSFFQFTRMWSMNVFHSCKGFPKKRNFWEVRHSRDDRLKKETCKESLLVGIKNFKFWVKLIGFIAAFFPPIVKVRKVWMFCCTELQYWIFPTIQPKKYRTVRCNAR
jgi:hypothetical protein